MIHHVNSIKRLIFLVTSKCGNSVIIEIPERSVRQLHGWRGCVNIYMLHCFGAQLKWRSLGAEVYGGARGASWAPTGFQSLPPEGWGNPGSRPLPRASLDA